MIPCFRFFMLALLVPSLASAASLSGVVHDGSGAPVRGATVEFATKGEPVRVMTDAAGRFAIENVSPEGTLWAIADGFAPGFAPVSSTREHVVRLEPERRADGRVLLNITGGPVAGATVVARLDGKEPVLHDPRITGCPFVPTVITDGGGRFELAGLYVGEPYQLEVEAPDCVPARQPLPPPGAPALTVVLTRGAVVSGTVVDASHSPVAAATVELTGSRTGTRLAWSDEAGEYTIAGVASENVRMRAWSDRAFTWKDLQSVPTRAGQLKHIEALVLEPGWTAEVVVTDASGRSIPAAVFAGGYRFPSGTPIDGSRCFGPMPPWQGRFVVAATGYVEERMTPRKGIPPGATETFTARLEARPFVTGRVVNSSGESVPGAAVGYDLRIADRFSGNKHVDLVADGSGCFVARPDYTPGYLWVDVIAPGYAKSRQSLSVTSADIQDVTLYRVCTLWGRAKLADGSIPTPATVTLTIPRHNARHAELQADGTWRAEDLPPGEYTLFADAPGSVAEPVTATALEGREVQAPDLVFTPGMRFAGVVVEEGEGKPIPGIKVTLKGQRTPAPAVSNEEGRFDMKTVRRGDYTVQVEDTRPVEERMQMFKDPRYGSGYGPLKFVDSDILDYRIEGRPGFHVQGRVVADDTSQPLEEVRIDISNRYNMGPDDYNYRSEGRTDAKGDFDLLVAGSSTRYGLNTGTTDGYAQESIELDAPPPGENITGLEIRLQRGVTLAGTVVSGTGAPVPDAHVNLLWVPTEAGEMRRGYTFDTDREGHFEHKDGRPGHYLLYPSHSRDRRGSWENAPNTVSVDLEAGESRTDIVLKLDEPKPERKPAHLAGSVVDGEGKPVADVQVHIDCRESWNSEYSWQGRTKSGPDGTFRIDGMQTGRFNVVANHEGGSFDAGEVVLPEDDFVITVDAVGGIAGRVEGSYGEAVTRFRVQTRRDAAQANLDDEHFRNDALQSSSDGSFKIEKLSPGSYRLAVQAEGYAPRLSEPIEVHPGQTTQGVVIHLSGGGAVEFHVVNESGKSIEGAMVFIDTEAWQFAASERSLPTTWSRMTNRDGLYAFQHQPEGKQIRVEMHHPSYARGQGEATVVAGKTQRVEIVLGTPGAVAGTVFDRNGLPMPNVSVDAHGNPIGGMPQRTSTRTDATGHYELRALTPGSWQVSARFTNSSQQTRMMVEVVAGQTTTVDFREASGRVFGVVTKGGVPMAGVRVQVSAQSAGGYSNFNAETDASGYYEIEGVPPGRCNVGASAAQNYGSGEVNELVDLKESESLEVNLILPSGAIRGIVVRAENDAPVSGAQVTAQREAGGQSGVSSFYVGNSQTDSEGRFEIAAGAGRYQITASDSEHRDLAPGLVTVEITEGQVLEGVKITLGSGGTIEGTVQIAGQPLPLPNPINLALMGRDGSMTFSRQSSMSVDQNTGTFKSGTVAEGDYIVIVDAPQGKLGMQTKPVSVKTGETTRMDFVLEPGVRVSFHITDAAGGVPSTIRFSWTGPDGLPGFPTNMPEMPISVINQMGSVIAFARQPYRFTFQSAGYKPANVDVDLTGCTDAERDVPVVMEKE